MPAVKNKNKIKGYKIVVEGQYYSMGDGSGKKPLKQYPKQTFYLPETVTYREGNTFRKIKVDGEWVDTAEVIPKILRVNAKKVALHIIRRYHLEFKLKESLEDFTGIRSCSVFSIEECMIDQDDFLKKDINDMSEAELTQFVAVRDLNVYLTMYGDLPSKKDAVKQAYKLKLAELAEQKEESTEEVNIYQVELDAMEDKTPIDPLADLM